jgi:hypothetical protein
MLRDTGKVSLSFNCYFRSDPRIFHLGIIFFVIWEFRVIWGLKDKFTVIEIYFEKMCGIEG